MGVSADEENGFSNQRWFVRRGQVTKGPFSTSRIEHFLTEKKLRPTDELSPDGRHFRQVTQWPPFAEGFDASREDRASRRAELVAKPLETVVETDPAPAKLAAERARRLAANADAGTPTLADADFQARRSHGRTATMVTTVLLIGLLLGLVLGAIQLFETQPELSASPSEIAARCNQTPTPGGDFSRCYLSRADLSDALLPGINLRSAMLVGARMDSADLSTADLAYADLSGATAIGARLTGARLIGAELVDAVLSGADLRGADLRYADLTGADLKDALLEGANFSRATWIDGRVCGDEAAGRCP